MKRGQLFSAIIFLLLALLAVLVLVSVQLSQTREQRQPELLQTQISTEFVSGIESEFRNVLKVSSYNALYSLDQYVRRSRQFSKNAALDFCNLVKDGTLPDGTKDSSFVPLQQWADKVHAVGAAVNLTVEIALDPNGRCADAKAPGIKMTSVENATVDYEISYTIDTYDKSLHFGRTLNSNANFSITGFEDPYVYLMDYASRCTDPSIPCVPAEKQIFFHPDPKIANGPEGEQLAYVLAPATRGKGWFYGPVASAQSGGMATADYVFVTTDPDSNFNLLQTFGAAIVAATPETSDIVVNCDDGTHPAKQENAKCLNCLRYTTDGSLPSGCTPSLGPWKNIVAKDFPYAIAPAYPAGNTAPVLIDSASWIDNPNANVWNIETVRSLAACALYVKNADALDFMQRLEGGAGPLGSSSQYGIESFAVGTWAAKKGVSNVDHEYFAGTPGTKAKGMPGCKNYKHCSDKGLPSPIGHFSIDDAHAPYYDLSQFLCSQGASCSGP